MSSRAVAAWMFAAFVAFGLSTATHRAAAATTVTWTGADAASALWSDPDNWSPGVPVAGDTIVFPAAAARKTNTNDLAPNTSFAGVVFDGAGYSIGGNAIVVSGSLENDPGTGTNVVALPIGGPGGIAQLSGKLVLAGANTFAGAADVAGGFLGVTNNTGLGNTTGATLVSSPAALQVSNGVDLGLEEVFLEGRGPADGGALQSLSGTNIVGTAWIDGAVAVGVSNGTLVIETLNQAASGSSLELVGGGKLQVQSAAFAGPVEVTEGNLTWNASSQALVDVERFGWLRGTGAVTAVQVNGGLVWPGSGNAPGALTVLGPTTFASGAFRVDLDGTVAGASYGQLVPSGLALAPLVTQLEVDLGFVPPVGHVFTIVANGAGPVQGTFKGLPEGAVFQAAGYAFQVSYKGGDGNDVTLKVLRQVEADLQLELSAQPSPAAAGELLIYTITVTNLGPDTAAGVRPTMGTPVGTTYESASGPTGWTCSKPNPSVSVSCMGPSLAGGASATFTFVFRVTANASGAVSATAGVSAATNDGHSVNNAATLVTAIGPGGAKSFKLRLPALAADSPAADQG